MIPLYICTNCGSEARVPHVGQELDGRDKTIRCIMCGTAMTAAGPWGTPAPILRAQAAANRAARLAQTAAAAPEAVVAPKTTPAAAPVARRPRSKRAKRTGLRPTRRRTTKKETPDAG
jgi:DNA-directed RNA polymerase subunit RPC12/RpoP